MDTDVLRGYSGDPPNPKDAREYISIDVALLRKTRKPEYFAFFIDPRAQADQGIFITFTKTVRDGNSWKMVLDPAGVWRLPIASCDKDACIARVPLGLVPAGKDSQKMNLLDKFLHSDSLLLLYMRGGHPYRTMVPLSSFKKDYKKVMANQLAKAKPEK